MKRSRVLIAGRLAGVADQGHDKPTESCRQLHFVVSCSRNRRSRYESLLSAARDWRLDCSRRTSCVSFVVVFRQIAFVPNFIEWNE
jgi:hypothetical protein